MLTIMVNPCGRMPAVLYAVGHTYYGLRLTSPQRPMNSLRSLWAGCASTRLRSNVSAPKGKKEDSAVDVSALTGTLTVALAATTLVLLGLLVVFAWRARRLATIARAAEQLDSIIRT